MNRTNNKSQDRSMYLRMMSLEIIHHAKSRISSLATYKQFQPKIARFLNIAFMTFAMAVMPTFAQEKKFTDTFMLGEEGYSILGSNPYFTLNPGYQLSLNGIDDGEFVELVITVLDETEIIDGVLTRVVREHETIDGELVEISRNFFALDNRTNSLLYFGEDVDIYENGEIIAHDGAWRAGTGGAKAGILLPGLPLLGARHFQEVAPGIALDKAEIFGIDDTVPTAIGMFQNCLKVEETSSLEPDALDYKYYAPGVGLVQSNSLFVTEIIGEPFFHVNDYTQMTNYTENFMTESCVFSTTGRNPFFILEPGYRLIYTGEEDGVSVGLTVTVLDEFEIVGGTETRVIEEVHTEDNEVIEISRNYFVICERTNAVFYFGEIVDNYEDGIIVNHNGSWRAGENGAVPGVLIPGEILLGARHFQEIAIDEAMDRAEIVDLDETINTPLGVFKNCLKTRETSPLEPDAEDFKFYAPGIGLIKDNELELSQVTSPSIITNWDNYQ